MVRIRAWHRETGNLKDPPTAIRSALESAKFESVMV